MTEPITATAADHRTGVAVEVGPGGALRGVTLTATALRDGDELARTLLRLSATATATANRRTALAVEQEFGPLRADDRDALGLHVAPAETSSLEDTVPDRWEVL